MAHVIEPATSGRAKCRGCAKTIAKGELRLGERLPNPFADEGEMTLWFHLTCGAYKRPEPLLEALDGFPGPIEDSDRLREAARLGLEHRRLPRIDGAERAPSGRAACRQCRETIAKDAWRLRLVFYEEGRFSPAGFVHVGCAATYCGTDRILERARRFSPALSEEEQDQLGEALAGS